MIPLFYLVVFLIVAIIFLIFSAIDLYKKYIRYKAITLPEFHIFAAATDKKTGDKTWRNDFKIYATVYKAAKKAKENSKK